MNKTLNRVCEDCGIALTRFHNGAKCTTCFMITTATSEKENCCGCGTPVGAVKLVVHNKGRQTWHIKCYKAVQRVLAKEELLNEAEKK